MRIKASFLAVFALNATVVHAECGVNKPLKIFVEKSYHADKVTVPMPGCKTTEGPCTASGTIFIVSTKKIKYMILLPDGTEGNLEVGESYSATVSCGKTLMMIPKRNDGKPIGAFYVLEETAQPAKAPPNSN
jgi:hypothetical protein